MFLHITVNHLCGQPINIIHVNMLFCPLYCDIINLQSLKITQAFHLLLGFAENQIVFWDSMSIRITEGLDNGDSGLTIASHLYFATHSPV